MKRNELIIIHILVWSIYFIGLIIFVDLDWYDLAENKGMSSMYLMHWSASRFGDVVFAYLASGVIFQKFLLNKRYFFCLASILFLFVFHYLYDVWSWNWFTFKYFWLAASNTQRVDIISDVIRALIIGFVFFACKNWQLSFVKRRKLEAEVEQTELKFLKSQISPHFLFNVFNNIYSLSLDINPITHEAIHQLKSIMYYVQIFENKQEIALKEERNHLQKYIDLNRLRYPLKVVFNSSFDNPNLVIEPMIFLPFFENAFKHGKTGDSDEIEAFIQESNGILNFEIVNEVDAIKRKDDASGVGLENIKKRLPFLYEDYSMDVIQNEGKYKVKIRINLGKKYKY